MASKSFRLTLPILRFKSSISSPSSNDVVVPKSITRNDDVADDNDHDHGQLWQVFCYFDHNNDGKISVEELRAYFKSVGDSISEDEAEKVVTAFDRDGDNLLEFNDFVQLMRKDSKDNGREDIKKAFEMFEVEKGSGCITPRGLQVVLNRLGGGRSSYKSLDECKAMIRVFDIDGNGVLDFDEFHKMMS